MSERRIGSEERQAYIRAAATEAVAEAARALQKHGPDNTMDGPSKTDGDRLAILVEEVGEVAKELTYDHAGDQIVCVPNRHGARADLSVRDGYVWLNPAGASNSLLASEMSDGELAHYGYRREPRNDRLRKELIQTAAMALTWAAMLP